MNINSSEQTLAKYHVLHFVVGMVLAAILLLIPKPAGVLFTIVFVSLFLPDAILPDEFPQNKWLDRGALLLGGVAVGLVFLFLHKL
jgi:hypothetical protein